MVLGCGRGFSPGRGWCRAVQHFTTRTRASDSRTERARTPDHTVRGSLAAVRTPDDRTLLTAGEGFSL